VGVQADPMTGTSRHKQRIIKKVSTRVASGDHALFNRPVEWQRTIEGRVIGHAEFECGGARW
jgi:hypothetical protein